jgi:hypothetical protein
MSVAPFWATLCTNRASWRDGPSFSPPTACRVAASAAVSAVGTPSANSRTRCGKRVPSSAVSLPTMSLVNMACTSVPAVASCWAMCADPYSPSSSPATAANMIVASVCWVAMIRASSRTVATPDPSSSAPGASLVEFARSVTRES